MGIGDRLAEVLVRTEEGLDRLKLGWKRRFNRFSPAHIVPYRGYGRSDILLLTGRVLEAEETGFDPEPGLWTNIRNTIRRLETDEIRGASIRVRFRDVELEVEADDEAFFTVRVEPDPPVEPGWHEVELEVVEAMAEEHVGAVTGEVLVPPGNADFMVVSDLDDTVLRTGAEDRLTMFRTVLLNDARSRTPFHGVHGLYRALEAGPDGGGANPFFYLSRSAWNLYPMLEGFLAHQDLPKGPLLLKDYGLREILTGGGKDFKEDALRHLLEFYDGTPFVLVGDSGQRDPEIYRELALEHPERIEAIVIRDVAPSERDREVRGIAEELDRVGVPMILANESDEAARRLADLGLIEEERVEEIEVERESEESAPGILRRMWGGRG